MRGGSITALAAYMPDQFLIVMEPHTPLLSFGEPGGLDPVLDSKHVPVFVHEYWHYLHNVSTLAGVMSLLRTLETTMVFTKTVCARADGSSAGSAALDNEDKGQLYALVEMEKWCEGDTGPVHDEANVTTADVIGIEPVSDTVPYGEGEAHVKNSRVSVRFASEDGRVSEAAFRLGNRAIEESVASLAEQSVLDQLPRAERMPAVSAQEPQFPYGVVTAVLRYFMPHEHDLAPLALELGTLSLLTTAPGYALPYLCERYAKLRRNGSDHKLCINTVAREEWDRWRTAFDYAGHDLISHANTFAGRGSVEQAVKWLTTVSGDLLRRRLRDPLFDVNSLLSGPAIEGVAVLTREIMPCDVLQRRDGEEGLILRDRLARFGTEEADALGYSIAGHVRVLQAQHSYVMAHLNPTTGAFRPSEDVSGSVALCPYFTCCELGLRKEEVDICKCAPWFHVAKRDGCWYAAAVNGTLGTVRQLPSKKRQC